MRRNVRKILYKKLPQIILLCIADLAVFLLASYLSLALRFDFGEIPTNFLNNLAHSLPLNAIIVLIVFYLTGLYTSVWRYASVVELLNVVAACAFVELFTLALNSMFSLALPASFYFLHFVLMFILISGVRFSYRILRIIINSIRRYSSDKTRTLLFGAGEAGRMVLDEMMRNVNANSQIMCIVDDDKKRWGTRLRRIPIVGGRHKIEDAVKKYKIEEIIIAIPSAPKDEISKIVTECQRTDCEIKILPSIFREMNKDSDTAVQDSIRPISYEDFLGRDQIVVNNAEIFDSLIGKTILVTGGGGSIGSELCRQIAKCKPERLIVFDIYENNAYDIQQELVRKYPEMKLETIIGSVRDYQRLEKVFTQYHPDLVFHAAAHKHVPLMEVSPNEAVKNNCLGTLNTVKLADKYKVKKFVLISTDKAVRPTNVMGATKRICEMIVQTYDKISETDFVAVRFGNVLGSNGSVIPLFLKQIENGGPVTVTDKEVTRYFMTIPEAVSLVIQASVYAKGGEIFVLDMGKPVKIYDLAKQIIRYKGYKPDKDIKIEITGLRPGEKMYEEMLMDEEGMKSTPNKLIFIGHPIAIKSTFLVQLEDLIRESKNNSEAIKQSVAKIVDTYKVE
ncbi:polysaccharide biosynthesis protein [Candidatus Saccharibacteria bacterium]|nr:polysaccharide biosynthesis protein [Candidatus Saccharibacteria bacterium]